MIFSRLIREQGNAGELVGTAMKLLAGKPLSPHIDCFVNFALSYAVNPYQSNYNGRDFCHLLCFNHIDWRKTKAALKAALEQLPLQHCSKSGKWAVVALLRASGTSDNGIEAKAIENSLISPEEMRINCRLVEEYCPSDPCDPNSAFSEQITETAKKYGELSVETLHTAMWSTQEDHFLNYARPGLARFSPDIIIQKHRDIITNIASRSGLPLRQGVFAIDDHAILITADQAREFVTFWKELRGADNPTEHDTAHPWLIPQSILHLAYPHLNTMEKLETFLELASDETYSTDLLQLVPNIGTEELEQRILEAAGEKNFNLIALLLAIANTHQTPIGAAAHNVVLSSVLTDKNPLQYEALRYLAFNASDKRIKRHAMRMSAIAGHVTGVIKCITPPNLRRFGAMQYYCKKSSMPVMRFGAKSISWKAASTTNMPTASDTRSNGGSRSGYQSARKNFLERIFRIRFFSLTGSESRRSRCEQAGIYM